MAGSTDALLVGPASFDAFHGRIITNPRVPAWWPAFCLAYDGVAAGYLAVLLLRGKHGPRARAALI